jgi:hypothetical protein
MQKYFNYFLDEQGNRITAASVSVKTSAGGAATIYGDNSGTTTTNPLTTDGSGYFEFYAPNGTYSLVLSKIGYTTVTLSAVLLDDPTVASIAALRAAGTPTTSNTRITVLGYTTAGDGGGGEFYWDASSTDADDGGITILPTGYAGTGRWKRHYEGAILGKWFGLVTGGITDNTTTFASAVAATPTGGTLELQEGDFLGDIVINKSIRVIGSGKPRYNGTILVGGTIIKGYISSYAQGVEIGWLGIDQSGTVDADGLFGGSATDTDRLDFWWHDLTILGRGTASGSTHACIAQGGEGVKMERINAYKFYHGFVLRCSYGEVESCYAEDMDGTSVILKAGATAPVNHCRYSSARNTIARAKTAGKVAYFRVEVTDATYQTDGATLKNCISIGSNTAGFSVENTAATGGTDLRNIELIGCKVYDCTATRGFAFISGDNILVRHCHVEDGPAYSYGGDGATNVRLIGCTSRSPTAGHVIGAFQEYDVNGAHLLEPSTNQGGPFWFQAGASIMTSPPSGMMEYDTIALYLTLASVRRGIDTLSVSADKGDAAATLTLGTSESTVQWNTILTADRAVTLSVAGAYNGARFKVVRTAAATGAFNLNVGTGPLKALTAGQWCEVEYDGSAWMLTAYGTL